MNSLNATNDPQPNRLNILLIRPGLTELDEQGRIVGTLDIPLSERGEEEAERMAEQIAHIKLEKIYTSPCVSAQQTATAIVGGRHIKTKVVESLTNLDYGLWQGMKIEDLRTNQPKLVRKWEEFPESVCPPAGEPIEDVLPRVEKLLKQIIKKYKSGNVAIVAPEPLASIIRSLLTSTKIGDLLKAQAQSFGVEIIVFDKERFGVVAAK